MCGVELNQDKRHKENLYTETARNPRRRQIARLAVMMGGIAILLLGVAFAFWKFQRTGAPMGREELATSVLASLVKVSGRWEDMASVPAHSLPRSTLSAVPHQWQRCRMSYGQPAIVFDLSRKRGHAYLFVLGKERAVDVSANVAKLMATGGWGVWAWQDASHVYVLAADEQQFRIEDFLKPSRDVVENSPGARHRHSS